MRQKPQAVFVRNMMKHRLNLFTAGFNVFAPTLYYRQLAFANGLKNSEDPSVLACLPRVMDEIENENVRYRECLGCAIRLAGELEIDILPAPDTVNAYAEWLKVYIDAFESQFPMSRIDHYYFLYSRKISEILCNLRLITFLSRWSPDLHEKVDLSRPIEKSLKDTEYILFKLVAAAALLSSEPRHNYFNVYYKTLNNEFLPIKDFNPENFSPEKLFALSKFIGQFEAVLEDGYKKCNELLEQLQY